MKSRKLFAKKYVNAVAGDVHLASPEPAEPKSSEVEFSQDITKKMSERNRHIGTINNALNKLLDGEMTPEEYVDIVSSENEKLSNS